MTTESAILEELGSVPAFWTRRHLLGLEELSAEEITLILDKAAIFRRVLDRGGRKVATLTGNGSAWVAR